MTFDVISFRRYLHLPTGADILVHRLHHHGLRTIFGMPGSHTTSLYDAFARHGGFRTILVRNEQAGAFCADGFARVTGTPGVICTTAGPGATNALTGIGEAWADSIPLLLLTGQVNHDRLHQECGAYHEIDLEGIFRPCTKYVATMMSLDDIVGQVDRAVHAMVSGRPRPVALVLPQDLMAASGSAFPTTTPTLPEISIPVPDEKKLSASLTLLRQARRPMILAGGGAVWAGAEASIEALAERIDAVVVTTLNGKGILDERHPRSLGHARSARAQAAWPHADLILSLGCRFTEVFTGFRKLKIPGALIQVDLDRNQLGVNYPTQVAIEAEANAFLRMILNKLPTPASSQWGEILERARRTTAERPEWFIDTLRANLPDNAVVFTDASEMAYRMHMDFPAYRPRSFFYPSNFIALGWGFPAAVGAAVALPDRWVASVSGDGGFTMTSQELATAARYKLKVIAIIHNDSTYGAIKNIQQRRHDERYLDVDLNNPDFLKLAEAYGVPATRAPDAATFARALQDAQLRNGPTLIEVPDQWRFLRPLA